MLFDPRLKAKNRTKLFPTDSVGGSSGSRPEQDSLQQA